MTATSRLALDLELANSIDVESGLSEWEANFVDSILQRLRGERKELTDKQRHIAERIQRRLDGGAP